MEMSEIRAARVLLGGRGGSGAGGNGSGGGSGQATVRYGTVTAVDPGAGTVTVLIDGQDAPVTLTDPTAAARLAAGDRVKIVKQGQSWVIDLAAGLSRAITSAHDALAERIDAKGAEVLASAKADLDQVDKAFADFKEKHALTDDDIAAKITASGDELSASFEGKISDLGETYAKKADVKADIDGLRSEASESYQSKADAGEMRKDLESRISQTSDAITAEVSDRTEAVSGALRDAKSYTDQQAESISSTVERNVTDSIGETYATKTEVKQASDSLHLTVTGEISTAKSDVKSDLAGDISSAQSDASAAKSSASSALSKASSASDFISTHFSATTSGLDVYSSASGYKARTAPGAFKVLTSGNTELFSISAASNGVSVMSSWQNMLRLGMRSSMGLFVFGGAGVEWNAANGVPMKRGGQNLGTGYYRAWHQLYKNANGTTGTVALGYSAGSFEAVAIFYKDGDGNCCSCIVPMLSSTMYADLVGAYAKSDSSPGMYVESRTVTVGGTSITNYGDRGGRFWSGVGAGSLNMASNTAIIKIIAVYGLKS